MVTRTSDKLTYLHPWFGRAYILSMFWSTATSLLIHNTGLPLATLISFAAVIGGLTIGWIVILAYKQKMNSNATQLVQQKLVEGTKEGKTLDPNRIDLKAMHEAAMTELNDAKTFWQRMISLKTLHGVLFFVSWFQIAGRMFASNQSGDFTCYTYPVYKPIDTAEGDYGTTDDNNDTIVMVPENDPNWDHLPWSNGVVAWCMALIFGSAAIALLVGAVWTYILVRQQKRRAQLQQNNSDEALEDEQPSSAEGEEGKVANVQEES